MQRWTRRTRRTRSSIGGRTHVDGVERRQDDDININSDTVALLLYCTVLCNADLSTHKMKKTTNYNTFMLKTDGQIIIPLCYFQFPGTQLSPGFTVELVYRYKNWIINNILLMVIYFLYTTCCPCY